MLQKEFRAMGSRISIQLDADTTEAGRNLEYTPAWFEEWEESLSRFRAFSELNMVNSKAGSRIQVSDIFWQVLAASLDAEKASGALVSAAILPALESVGYVNSFAAEMDLPDPYFEREIPESANMKDILLFPETREVKLPDGMRLDFGGTAKGWAAHQTMQRLSKFGPVMVNAGGDISFSGLLRDGNAWQAGIIDPLRPDTDLVKLNVGRCGLATSGKDFRKWLQDGVLRHHIIDPRTGIPAETDILSASVYAADVLQAEMAAKTIFILGSQDGAEWLKTHPELGVLLVMDDGDVFSNTILKKCIRGKNG